MALGTSDSAVYDMFVRARERADAGGPQAVEEAIRLLETVVSRDTGYAPAHALLARAYVRSVADGMSRLRRPNMAHSSLSVRAYLRVGALATLLCCRHEQRIA